MKRTALLAVTACLTSFSAAMEEAPDFVRVEEDAKAVRLQTAITRYEKNGVTVDLIGAIHIGDKAYYEALNKRFEKCEVLLFEMIGGEKIAIPEPVPAAAEPPSPLHAIYDQAARKLDLTGQVDHIDYTAKNFVHADLTAAEFAEKQTERGESLLTFLMKNQAAAKTANQPNPLRLLYAIASGRADLLKLAVIRTLGDADDQIAGFAGENVVISDRNVRCLEVLARELAAGRKNVGIFYGAAHFPDMEKRLFDQGFTRSTHEWITAWNVLKPLKKPAAEP